MAYTQTQEHQQRWWVVPELAARSHAEKILVILEEMAIDRKTIDTISVTAYPWLPGALVVGVTTAYTLGKIQNKPVVEVNHIMGHVFSVLVERTLADLQCPYVCLTVSGWHNDLYLVQEKSEKILSREQQWGAKHNHLSVGQSVEVWSYTVTKLGQTIDDASGECFDKVARMLWWPYPGGRRIDEQAATCTTSSDLLLHAAKLPDQPYNFSFSGIKWQVYQHLQRWLIDLADKEQVQAVAHVFQEQVTEVLQEKLQQAVYDFAAQSIGVVWWVSANQRLREKIQLDSLLWKRGVLFPTKFVYCTDNAAMIGVVWLITYSEHTK